MPIRPYLTNQSHIVVRKAPGYLEMETGSGRNVFVFAAVFVLLFQADVLKYPGLFVCVTIWSYSKRWIFDRNRNEIRGQGRVFGMKYDDVVAPLDSVREIFIELSGLDVGYACWLKARFENGSAATIAIRNNCELLLRMVKEFRSFVPSAKLLIPDTDECKHKPEGI